VSEIAFYEPKWFDAHEFLPPEVYDIWGKRGLYYFIDVRVVVTADQIREFFGAPFKTNNWWWRRRAGRSTEDPDCFRYRGYRPDAYYTSQGTLPNGVGSQHRFGRALDGDVVGVTAAETRDVIMNHQDRFPYIRRIEDNVNWLHFDVANTFHNGIHLIDPRR
jgi:hypothetical protein